MQKPNLKTLTDADLARAAGRHTADLLLVMVEYAARHPELEVGDLLRDGILTGLQKAIDESRLEGMTPATDEVQ